MVTCKNNPGQDKESQKQDYRPYSSLTDVRYTPSYRRLAPLNHDSIDELVQPSTVNRLYHKRYETSRLPAGYDLSKPVWFDEIIKRLTNDDARQDMNEYRCLN